MTQAKNPQAVMRRLEVEFARDFVLFVFDNFAVKLNQGAALRANQMIVMLVIVTVFVARVAIGKSFLSRQTAFRQELERAINSGESDRGVFGFDKVVQIFGAGMSFGTQKDF